MNNLKESVINLVLLASALNLMCFLVTAGYHNNFAALCFLCAITGFYIYMKSKIIVRLDDPYLDGILSRNRGDDITSNPFDENDINRVKWRNGYMSGNMRSFKLIDQSEAKIINRR